MIELRRQIFHLFMGVLIVLLLMLKIINAKIIFCFNCWWNFKFVEGVEFKLSDSIVDKEMF